ncbi:unnamed protein product [Rotaria magnacalcarata]|nr:unnamed protein product [Rotaria magnacalcarata]CAF3809144.1 unnamed protein product [Rotaria magnacalcarata]CAF4055756.1 unnamed protein product [Rotaria magnacalcarata]
MASLAESESRFRIFDLSDTGPNQFRVSVLGQQRIFNTPQNVQVKIVNTRRDINCEDLSYDYAHFFSNYFRSTRSTSSWSAFIVSGSTSRYNTLRRIQEAITKSSKAVATSTSWWGLYSIQLGPPFIIKLDPMFNESMMAIINEPHTPRTEAQQIRYNMLLDTFGTHYVTHVIVGAIAHIFTLLSDAYAKSSSFQETMSQVSRMGHYFFLSSYSTDYSHRIEQSITESFRKTSQSFVEYRPPVPQVPGKTEWQSWLSNALSTPVVVNRTLAPLSNLFYRYPLVQAHLRRTINYFLNHGRHPMLADLNR